MQPTAPHAMQIMVMQGGGQANRRRIIRERRPLHAIEARFQCRRGGGSVERLEDREGDVTGRGRNNGFKSIANNFIFYIYMIYVRGEGGGRLNREIVAGEGFGATLPRVLLD